METECVRSHPTFATGSHSFAGHCEKPIVLPQTSLLSFKYAPTNNADGKGDILNFILTVTIMTSYHCCYCPKFIVTITYLSPLLILLFLRFIVLVI